MIKQKIKDIKEGKLNAVDNIKGFLDKIKKENDGMNIVLQINDKALDQAKEVDKKIKDGDGGKLAGLGFLVKSNINVEGMMISCASKTLEGYNGVYNARVIDRLIKEDAIVLGMVNMDEFACGATGENSAFGVCVNPRASDRIPGGSSSGSAAGVAAGFCDFSLGSDTGGSIRNPASHCGVVGYKPSYGSVSRYGLVDMSMSLDQIGPLGNDVEDCEVVFDLIKGRDENDSVSRDFDAKVGKLNGLKIGVLNMSSDKEIWQLVTDRVHEVIKKNSWNVGSFNLDYVDLGIQTYYPIVYTEFFSGTRKFDGRKYGKKIEDVCGEEVLRRIIGGSEITKAEHGGRYYHKALKAKKLIEKEFEKAFKKYDLIIIPTVPRLPHKVGEKISVEDCYNYDSLTVLANLAEIPGISIPVGDVDGIPVGMQILAAKGRDKFLFKVAREFEK
ncbi:Asp-tRNA(Asn)/Glu-tRNA(Gln) amidotransferase GatCAB subunit A [Candidatus Pacearchaeota archaeon]|nr:Asp-tRNA(Asn)/Glu-tRNA(Gln) amidotransferase GatCAB subunit A [Candidatus Pacearchaeota archaeon]|tara:strand:+ start:995 stop:2323 length:1329 start_codon:yes stop_codon:yes gene_type:complete